MTEKNKPMHPAIIQISEIQKEVQKLQDRYLKKEIVLAREEIEDLLADYLQALEIILRMSVKKNER